VLVLYTTCKFNMQKYFMPPPISTHRALRRHVLKNQHLIKSLDFIASSRTCFFVTRVCGVKNTMMTTHLDSCWGNSVMYFCTSSVNMITVKRQKRIHIIMKITKR
jgi:hypothetical protein